MIRYRTGICAVAATLAIAGVAGCGDDEAGDQTVAAPSSTGSETSAPEGETGTAPEAETGTEAPGTSGTGDAVEIIEFVYEPEELTVPAGTTVTFTNQDTAPHTATADDSSFDTERLEKDDSAELTFDEPGTFTYYCRFHVFMKGSVVVE